MGLNYLAILVAAVAMYIVGMLWYGPLFGAPWRRLMNIPEGPMRMPAASILAGGFVATLVMAIVLAMFEGALGATTAIGGTILGFWLWLGFVAPVMINTVFYERRPWALYAINVLHYLVALVLGGIILAVW